MTANERRAEIMRIMTARRQESMGRLALELGVTRRTIRSDITTLTVDYPLETQRLRRISGQCAPADADGIWLLPTQNEERKIRMSRVNLLLDVVEDMRSLADSLQSVADSIQGNTAAPEEVPTQPVDNTPQITIDQVRTLLAEKSGEGKTQAVKALLYKYDAGKLSGVKPEDYAALMEEARKL